MKNKKVVRLTESQLHNIIAESVKKIINEWEDMGEYESEGRKKFTLVDNTIPKLQEITNQINSMWYDIGYSASERYKNADGDFDNNMHTKHKLELLNQAIELSTDITKEFEFARNYIIKYENQGL